MNIIIKQMLGILIRFFADKRRYRIAILGILCIFALVDFLAGGLARRTYVFYAVSDGSISVEDRMIKRASTREQNIARYTDEAILGPVLPDFLPLFAKGTRLLSLLYRDDMVYIDFSEDAAMPPEEGGEVLKNLITLKTGIIRNFSYVSDVCFFINGKAVYPEFL
jgi:spore germination protein GerM